LWLAGRETSQAERLRDSFLKILIRSEVDGKIFVRFYTKILFSEKMKKEERFITLTDYDR